jgi:D-alanyl-lipoteichoic acid acyltransferase DltB (MBOAT superfamily)
MSVLQVLILAGVAIGINKLKQGRSLALLGISTFVIFWIQPIQEPANLTFWFPTFTLALTMICWLLTSTPESRTWQQNGVAVAVMLGAVILVDLNHYFQIKYFFITDTPRVSLVVAVLLSFAVIGISLSRVKKFPAFLLVLGIAGLIIGLVLLKTPSALTNLIEAVAGFRGKEAGVASAFSWLGFSYVAFRLMHTLIDRRAGRLPSVSLGEYVSYVIFFPAISAGPIDRLERFSRNLNEPVLLTQEAWLDSGMRLFWGLFKKFVIADGLGWFALSEMLALNTHATAWTWIFLYAYSLQIYFDFSGYTDIAIGLGKLLGIQLPENFDAPYLKPNLTQFWNAWHMTLTQWFRSYFFNPLTRFMRSQKIPLPMWLMILVAQLATMALIGLWHGVTLGFLLWGVWHGLGLFVQNRWSVWMRNRVPAWGMTPRGALALRYSGVLFTFHYVTLGWLFFFLPDPRMAWSVMLKLVGAA